QVIGSAVLWVFFFQAEDGIRDFHVTGVQTCALPISRAGGGAWLAAGLEAGLLPGAGRIGAVGRIGWDGGTGAGGLGGLRLGAGLSHGEIAVDYAYQDLDPFGPVHPIGIRWRRAGPCG